MKKLKFLLVVLAAVLILPFGVFAEEVEDSASEDAVESQEVNVYFFFGDGCGFCANAEAWFEEIEEEYGDKFNLVAYEVWSNADNSQLMSDVAEIRKETANGVPYIIIGNQSWNGFDDDYKEGILAKIESEYEQDPAERYDIMEYVESGILPDEEENNTAKDVLVLLVLVGVVAAVAGGVAVARKNID